MAKKITIDTSTGYTPKVPIKMTAIVAKASEVQVRKVRANKRDKGPVAKRVKEADKILSVGLNKLVEEAKRVVNF